MTKEDSCVWWGTVRLDVRVAEDGSLACHAWRLSCCVEKLRKRGIGLTAIPKTRFGVVGMAQFKIWRMRAIVVSALQARAGVSG